MAFKGKVVLITGASAGIGARAAEAFAKDGANVVLVGRNEENLKKVAKNCPLPLNGLPHLTITADLTKETDVERIIKSTIDYFGQLDILINNAGILERGLIENTNLASLDRVMNTNFRAVFQLTSLAVPYLLKTKGNIVNISSIAGSRSYTGFLPYSISKAALDHFTKCISLELAPKKVRVNSVNPGLIVTDIQKTAGMSDTDVERLREEGKIIHPLGRVGEVNDVVDAILYLASEKASFITGCILPVDGGRHTVSAGYKRSIQ